MEQWATDVYDVVTSSLAVQITAGIIFGYVMGFLSLMFNKERNT